MRYLLALALVTMACAHNTPQDKRTGADGRAKGALPMTLVNNQARTRGIVTYPGGDRVDWKSLELPANAKGRLEFKLTWDVPRPGLRLGFDVFDAYYKPVAASNNPRRGGRRVRDVVVENAQGKYFIRVYADRRRDAGRYKLVATLSPQEDRPDFDPLTLKVSDPPPLADAPEAVEPCTNENFDVKKKECKTFCPDPRSLAPRDWKPCAKICDTPDAENPACWPTMKCPLDKPDTRITDCTPDKFPPCNPAAPAGNPNCKPKAIVARVQKNQLGSGGLEISIPAGSEQLVTKQWTAFVLQGMQGDNRLPNGAVKILRVDRTTTKGVVQLTTDQIRLNPRVKLVPPKQP